jgi:hypothetical protein
MLARCLARRAAHSCGVSAKLARAVTCSTQAASWQRRSAGAAPPAAAAARTPRSAPPLARRSVLRGVLLACPPAGECPDHSADAPNGPWLAAPPSQAACWGRWGAGCIHGFKADAALRTPARTRAFAGSALDRCTAARRRPLTHSHSQASNTPYPTPSNPWGAPRICPQAFSQPWARQALRLRTAG